MSEIEASDRTTGLDDTIVHDYLSNHPDYLLRHADLLETLELPESTILELQDNREGRISHNEQLSEHVSELFDLAKQNTMLFEKVKRFVLSVLDAENFNQIAEAISASLTKDFSAPVHRLLLFRKEPDIEAENVYFVPLEEAVEVISAILDSSRPICGILRDEEKQFLFSHQSDQVGSAAIVPLRLVDEPLGVLAIGSGSPNYYSAGMGDLFISYMGDVLVRILVKSLVNKRI